MKKKDIVRVALFAFAAVVVLLLALAILVHTPAAKSYMGSRIEEHARRRYGALLKIDRYSFSFLRGTISIEGVSLRSVSASEAAPLFYIKKAHFDLNWIPILTGRTSVQSAEFEGVDIHISVNKDGHMNLPRFSGGGGSGGLLIKRFEIKNGNLSIEDRRQQIGIHLSSWQIRAKDIGTDLSSHITFIANESGALNYRENRLEISNLQLEADASMGGIKIKKLHLNASGSKVEGLGVIRDFSNPIVDLKIDADIDLEKASAFFGQAPGIKGRAIGTVYLVGPLGDLQIQGKIRSNITSVQPMHRVHPPVV